MTGRDDLEPGNRQIGAAPALGVEIPLTSSRPATARRLAAVYTPAVVAFAAVILLWEGTTRLLDVETFLLPKPSEIITSFVDTWSTVWEFGFRTLWEAFGGFVIGVVAAVATSFAAVRWVRFREGMLPIAIAMNSMPIVALAPIFNNWFGSTNVLAKMSVAAVVVYFPVMINTTRGLLEVDPGELELMRSVAAGPTETMRRVRIPHALPFFFASLKVASALSLIAAIIAEYFGGPQNVLGQYIINRANLFQFPDAWAAILVASLLGIAFYVLILVMERLAMPWHVSFRETE
jgi:NitT/TauT family transport system permease protein